MTGKRNDPSPEEIRSLLPLAYLLRDTESERSWPGEPKSDPAGGGHRRMRFLILPITAVVILAAAVIVIMAAAPRPIRPQSMTLLAPSVSAPQARGVILREAETVLVFTDGLPEPASGYRYVLWQGSGESLRRVGQLRRSASGSAYLRTDDSLEGEAFRITLEAAGVRHAPAGPMVLHSDAP